VEKKRRETVIEVIDGDTFKTSRRKYPVRLANVNAPEKRQRGYVTAKKELEDLILGEMVTVETVARDPYKRAVGKVKLGRKSINNAMKKKIDT